MTPSTILTIAVRLFLLTMILRIVSGVVGMFSMMGREERFVPELLWTSGLYLVVSVVLFFIAPLAAAGLPEDKFETSIDAKQLARLGFIFFGAILAHQGLHDVINFAVSAQSPAFEPLYLVAPIISLIASVVFVVFSKQLSNIVFPGFKKVEG